ncbi:hypothetical protein THAOC_16351 [Thalassiosira oceanica]|uniref:Uncharacterized protein n=1 Tax=Thalassiosira oceanica TaxID=159749 RepID=K0SDH9_THAOC|nr:hypothetical protein THAOC_16351 [Thalassiosira oceanica]|eukprot:EJK63014.1 hypothetical protein THAOC_16351 [Thalassiosira oceanica]
MVSAALFNDEARLKNKYTGRVSFSLRSSNLLEPTTAFVIVKSSLNCRGDALESADVLKALIVAQTKTLIDQGCEPDAAMDKAEKMWANTTVLVEAGYPEGHFEDLNRLCKLEGYALAAKKVKFVKIERTDVKLFDEIGSMEILCATLRNFMGRRLKLLFMGNEDGEVLLDVDVHSELYNNCHYNASCVSTAVKSPVYELDAPMVLQSRPKKGEIDETTGEPELIAVDPETTSLREILSKFTLSPSPSGTTRFLVQAVLTGGGSRVLLTYVKTEEHKAVIKLLVENAPGYIFFELIKKYEVLPVYAALLTWFGKAPVTASLNRTSHDGDSIVTNDSRSSRADTQSVVCIPSRPGYPKM